VRAMDTMAAFMEKMTGQVLSQFVIAGASKRGWTTWTTGAVDPRVVAMVPIVMDELNFVKNVHHHYRAYGGWSFAFEDYYALNFTAELDNPNVEVMASIIDPLVYADRYTFPKMVVDSSGDEFFLPDDEYYWWDQMPGPKHFLENPNAEHSCATAVIQILGSVSAFVNGFFDSDPAPEFSWVIDYNNTGNITVTVPFGNVQPTEVVMWVADSVPHANRRDFRLIGGYPNPGLQDVPWFPYKLQAQSPGNVWVAAPEAPATGWRGFFVALFFPGPTPPIGGDSSQYHWTTQTSIIPNTFPYPPCEGAGCYGHLL